MWLASFIPETQNPNAQNTSVSQNFLDLCLHLSPDVFLEKYPSKSLGEKSGQKVFIHLTSVAQYWQLSKVLTHPEKHRHPFLQHLQVLRDLNNEIHHLNSRDSGYHSSSQNSARQDFVSRSRVCPFVLAPTPSLAAWALELEHKRTQASTLSPQLLRIYNPMEIQKEFQQLSPSELSPLLEDQFQSQKSLRTHWQQFLEDLDYLGIRNILNLKALFQDASLKKQCFERFPELSPLLLQRLVLASKDYSLKAYAPEDVLTSSFYPGLEDALSSPSEQDLLCRIEDILRIWQLRLEARRSLLKGIELRLGFLRPLRQSLSKSPSQSGATEIYEHLIEIRFPHGLKQAGDITSLIREKLQHLPPSENQLFNLPLEKVELRSLGVERICDKQLSLFEQNREENLEKWRLLVGRLQSRSQHNIEISVGSFELAESYWPEESFLWSEWKGEHFNEKTSHPTTQSSSKSSLLEQPRRPLLFLEKPERLELGLRSFDEFLLYLRQKKALLSLEHICSPYGAQKDGRVESRYYARVGSQWIFWDEHKKCCFLQGYFEEIPQLSRLKHPPREAQRSV